MEPCTPHPRPLRKVCSLVAPIYHAQIHNPTTPMLHQDKLPLSLRRHFRLLTGITHFHPLCNATRQTLTLISYLTLHHHSAHRLSFAVSLRRSRIICPLRWNIHTP